MTPVSLAIRVQFNEDDIDLAYQFLRRQFKGHTLPPKEAFLLPSSAVPVNFSLMEDIDEECIQMATMMLCAMIPGILEKQNPDQGQG